MTSLDKAALAVIDAMELSDRVKKIRKEFFASKIHITADRAHLATMSWKETEGDHLYMRRAKLFARICDEIPIVIHPDELIVGSQTRHVRGASPQIDYNPKSAISIGQGDFRTKGDGAIAVISDDDVKLLKEDAEYWMGKSPEEKVNEAMALLGTRLPELKASGVTTQAETHKHAPILADFDKLLRKGLRGILEEIHEEMHSMEFTKEGAAEKWYLLWAGKLSCEAVIRYAKRHAQLARELAGAESDPQRKTELETIAQNCEWVPENPARTFWEALQAVRFIYICQNLETGSRTHQVGRPDQYLYSFYRRERDDGTLTLEQAADLLGCFQMKIAQMEAIHGARQIAQGNFGTRFTIGGLDRDGKDATNELSYLLLHICGQVKTPEPSFYVRWHPECPRELLLKGVWANVQVGGGSPCFHNDVHTIGLLTAHGASLEDARDYHISGCSHPYPYGVSQTHQMVYNGAKIFELVMYNGYDPRLKKQIGLKTGDPRIFTCIEDWIEAFKQQWSFLVPEINHGVMLRKHLITEHYANPFADILNPDCIKMGKAMERGGTRYPQFLSNAFNRVFADVADSLTAIKTFVYQNEKLTVDEILEACTHNFEGAKYGRILDMLTSAPKYGNDLEGPDAMFRLLNSWVVDYEIAQKNYLGYHMRGMFNAAAVHLHCGAVTGALPNGKKAGMPTASGSVSAVSGAERKGPTASLRSAGMGVDWSKTSSAILNQKMPKSLLRTKEHFEKFWSLMETYFRDYNGYQVQWNIEDAETYRAAKANPEAYKDLVVRVGGYSCYFVEVSPTLQDEIIERTEQCLS